MSRVSSPTPSMWSMIANFGGSKPARERAASIVKGEVKKCQGITYDQVVSEYDRSNANEKKWEELATGGSLHGGSYNKSISVEYKWQDFPKFVQRNHNILFGNIVRYAKYHETQEETKKQFEREFYDYSYKLKEEINKLITFSAKPPSEIFEELFKYFELLDHRFMYNYDPTVYGNDLPLADLLKKIMDDFQAYKAQIARDNDVFKLTEEIDYLKKCQAANEDKIKYMAEMIDGFAQKLSLKHELTL
jgi:hypothetical protein